MTIYIISKYKAGGHIHLKDEDCHRLNDKISFINFNDISYELNNKSHRENNQIAYGDTRKLIKLKYLHGERQ